VTPVNRQTILITGSTDGLGRATAIELAKLGAGVLIHGRDPRKIQETVEEIGRATGGVQPKGYLADLSELAQVRRLAAQIMADNSRLDMLINNAGIGAGNVQSNDVRREVSVDGYELRFAVNYLAPFLLTRLLLPIVKRSAPSRIINVSSAGQVPVDFDDLMLEKNYEPFDAYRRSKLAQIMDTIELAAELEGSGVTVNCLHPASLMNTKMVIGWFDHTLTTVEDGVESLMHIATSPKLDRTSGAYYDRLSQAQAKPQAYDTAARARLKKVSAELVGLAKG